MLINCPKCHLSQPEDQYCARCGLDMKAYKPPEKTFLEKVFSNYLVMGFLVVIIGLYLAYQTTHVNKEEKNWSSKFTKSKKIETKINNSSLPPEVGKVITQINKPKEVQNQIDSQALKNDSSNSQNANNGNNINTNTAAAPPVNRNLQETNKVHSGFQINESTEVRIQFYSIESESFKNLENQIISQNKLISSDPFYIGLFNKTDINILLKNSQKKLFSKQLKPSINQTETLKLGKNINGKTLGFEINYILETRGNQNLIKLLFTKLTDQSELSFPIDLPNNDHEQLLLFGDSLFSGFEFYEELLNSAPYNEIKTDNFKLGKTQIFIGIDLTSKQKD